jgi:hypothetical protein
LVEGIKYNISSYKPFHQFIHIVMHSFEFFKFLSFVVPSQHYPLVLKPLWFGSNASPCNFVGLSSLVSIFFFKYPHLSFNKLFTWSFTYLLMKVWSKYLKPVSRAYLMASNPLASYFWMSSITRLNFKA